MPIFTKTADGWTQIGASEGSGSFEPATIVSPPVSVSGPAVQTWPVKDTQGNSKTVYLLPGNTNVSRELRLTPEAEEVVEAELRDAVMTTEVPEDFDGDPVTLLPKKWATKLRGNVLIRSGPVAEATFSVTLGAGVLPGIMVGSGGASGYSDTSPNNCPPGGAGGVIGLGAHQPVILPVQSEATYTITVGSTTPKGDAGQGTARGQSTTISTSGWDSFATAVGGGVGVSWWNGQPRGGGNGASGGGGHAAGGWLSSRNGLGFPSQGHDGGNAAAGGGGGGYGSAGSGVNGGTGFDVAAALGLNASDSDTTTFLNTALDQGFVAGGGSGQEGTPRPGGGAFDQDAKANTGGGGGGKYWGTGASGSGKNGGSGSVLLIV
jgi:hypothetical protein